MSLMDDFGITEASKKLDRLLNQPALCEHERSDYDDDGIKFCLQCGDLLEWQDSIVDDYERLVDQQIDEDIDMRHGDE